VHPAWVEVWAVSKPGGKSCAQTMTTTSQHSAPEAPGTWRQITMVIVHLTDFDEEATEDSSAIKEIPSKRLLLLYPY
jgi:hypothetical protein